MPKKRPAIVLVHGAWHVPAHYAPFTQHLHQATGLDVFCPLLPTCDDTKRLTADLSADAVVVRSLVVSLIDDNDDDDGSREVIMLLHSYGGAVGAQAVDGLSARRRARDAGLPGGVICLIYMCGFMLRAGESVGGASLPRPVPDPVEVRDELEGGTTTTTTTFPREDPVGLFYADVEPRERAVQMVSLLTRQSGRAMTDRVSCEAWREVPTTYLMTRDDRVLFPSWQERQVRAVRGAGGEVAVETFESSHSPFLSVPGEMVAAVVRAVERHATL